MNDSINGSARTATSVPFDAWAVLDFWRRRWYWLAAWTIVLAIAGALAARAIWKPSYTSTAELMHYTPSAVDDTYHPRDIQASSIVLMLQSPQFMEKLGEELTPPESAQALAKRVTITLDHDNDIATVEASGKDKAETVALANRFCAAAVEYTKALQRDDAKADSNYVEGQLAQVETARTAAMADPASGSPGVQAARAALPNSGPTLPGMAAPDELSQKVEQAREQLDELLLQYTDKHPLVIEQQARLHYLQDLQKEQQQTSRAPGSPAPVRMAASTSPIDAQMLGRASPQEIALAERLQTLETNRAGLLARERALEPFRDNPPGYFKVTMPASATRTFEHRHRLEMFLFAGLGAFFGLVGSAGEILLGEFLDNRLKTRSDVRRVTGLPLIATLGDLSRSNNVEKEQWAFRTWTALQSKLSLSPNHGMVCGITSAHPGDGRSTWIELLARAAGMCGFRVLTITAQPSADMVQAQAATRPKQRKQLRDKAAQPAPVDTALSLSTNVLSAPGQITDQLAAIDGPPRVNIPLPGWVWNLDRRKQWGSALEAWRGIDHIVIFVELPPASHPETVLLAENIPNLLWLVDAGKSDAAETHTELETLRDARCNLVGAVLNRENTTPVRGRFTRWLGSSAFLLALLLLGLGGAPRAVAQDDAALSAPAQRAAWQENLTLGPGDVLTFHLFGAPELTRENVVIGPDGRVSYLEAENVQAAGLTVDQFRDRLNAELGKYRRSPQAYVIPVAYRSKHYYMLGTVVQKGSFPLDRPITIVEAVARARGFETSMSGGTVMETTDFSHAFLERDGKHVPVDFAALFQRGDLTQNIQLQPGDYLSFPALSSGQIFVLGAVKLPGPAAYGPDSNVLAAIADRGGFVPQAWRAHILVVRGSLDHPQTFVVNLHNELLGKGADLALQPGDIVYVAKRPWHRAEELLDQAATAFIESAVVTWTSIHVDGTGATQVVTP